MKIEHEILVNKYGQDLINIDQLISLFENFGEADKRLFINDFINLIVQSKPSIEDVGIAISNSRLKETYTPCVLLKKNLSQSNLYKIGRLPIYELEKAIVLFLNLFRIAYKRRYEKEKNNAYKWWYWDLSDHKNVERIENSKFVLD